MSGELRIAEFAFRVRADAASVVDRHSNPNQKAASLALYGVLASCMALCGRCERDASERAELERLFAEQPKAGNRRYVEKSSDVYVRVCRFVFTETDRTNAMRYSQALREAAKLQLNSKTLAGWTRDNGGVNALYFRRPLDARSVKTSALRLAEQIEFSRDRPFAIKLRWRHDNSFDVLAEILEPPAAPLTARPRLEVGSEQTAFA
jgi:hypothetical protein